jgi:hypothetical protein
MKLIIKILLFITFIISGECYAQDKKIIEESITIIDKSRNRIIPLEIYKPKLQATYSVVIINNGYGAKNTEYSFIANQLARDGYFVVSIQHDLKNDPPLPRTGDLFKMRKPLWQRGVQSILFVISDLKKAYPDLNLDKVILIGHSNGGDISMMFADTHPELTLKVISLDSLRYPFPIKDSISILSLRANDTKADEGVLPKTGAMIISLKDAKHMDMYDPGSKKAKQEIVELITKFLSNKL